MIFIVVLFVLFVIKGCIHELNYRDTVKDYYKHEQIMKGIKE